jgi:glycosyltransferase involved in cell wall biosynthesis
MRILMLHNFYQQPGGEDESFAAEADVMERNGHEVIRYTLHNDAIDLLHPVEIGLRTIWNPASHGDISRLLADSRPDVMHAQNVFPLISPAAYHAARRAGVPVVQSVRNYRMFCLNAQFFRDGRPCESCLGRTVPLAGLRNACYRGSTLASASVATMLMTHRLLGTWSRCIDLFVTLSEFSRRKCIESGLPADRVVTKPNFLKRDPGAGDGEGGYALFVGRLSPEKGIGTMLEAWRKPDMPMPLRVVGDGPEGTRVAGAGGQVEWLGRRDQAQTLDLMRRAAVLVFPSEWYETFGRVAVEAFAAGTPVVVARIGAVAELVDHGRTGLLYEPGDAEDLAAQIRRLTADPKMARAMRRAARQEYETKYTAERNYHLLSDIYRRAMARQPVPQPATA